MKGNSVWSLAAVALLSAALVVTSCAGPAAGPTPTPEPTAMPTSTPRPTRTPTPIPPTPTPSPTPTDAQALLLSLQSQEQNITNYRGAMDITVEATSEGISQSFDIQMEVAAAEPDSHMRMLMDAGFLTMDIEMITKDGISYLKMGDEWTSFEGEAQSGSQMEMVDPAEMEAFLKHASNLRIVGQREVRGTLCDVVAFDLDYASLARLAALGGEPVDPQDIEDMESVQFDNLKLEIAVGLEDKQLHQFVLEMEGYEKAKPEERFKMFMTMDIWDIGADDIVIEAPANVKPAPGASELPFTIGTPSPNL